MLLPTTTMFFQNQIPLTMRTALEHHRRLRQAMPGTLMMALHAGRYLPPPAPELAFEPVASEARVPVGWTTEGVLKDWVTGVVSAARVTFSR